MQRYGGEAEYEFSPTQNEIIEDLARKMRFVGLMGIILGLVSLLGGVAGLFTAKEAAGLTSVVQGLMLLVVGVWTRSAAGGFQTIVDTQGSDIANLMGALNHLRRIYSLQRIVFVVALLVLVLLLQLTLLAMARGAH